MASTQVRGNQIKDADITSADLANYSVIPVKISNISTDDFTFPRDITASRNLIVTNNLINTHTVPSGTDTFTLNNATQTLLNKTLTSPIISTIVNTGNITLPTSTDTLLGRATTDTLTNKTLTSTTNTVTAKALFSASTTVDVSAATAPTSGQVLTATSNIAATWQTPVSSGHTIQDEGVSQTQRSKLNFIGNAVTVSDNSGNDSSDVSITYTNIVLSDDEIISSDDEIVISD